jgi:hypothetical protein
MKIAHIPAAFFHWLSSECVAVKSCLASVVGSGGHLPFPLVVQTVIFWSIQSVNYRDDIFRAGHSKVSDRNASPVERDTISKKTNSTRIIPRLDNCPTIPKYAIIDRLTISEGNCSLEFRTINTMEDF